MRNACRTCVSTDPSPLPAVTNAHSLFGPSHILILYSTLRLRPSWARGGRRFLLVRRGIGACVQLGGVRTGVGSSQEFAVNSRVYNELRTASKHMEKAGARLKGTRAGRGSVHAACSVLI
jgi:hypothetical protein